MTVTQAAPGTAAGFIGQSVKRREDRQVPSKILQALEPASGEA